VAPRRWPCERAREGCRCLEIAARERTLALERLPACDAAAEQQQGDSELLDEDSPFGGSDLEVKEAQKVHAENPLDTVAKVRNDDS
jgi:hypothetical protein